MQSPVIAVDDPRADVVFADGAELVAETDERYDLIIPKRFADLDKVQALLDIIHNSEEFQETVKSLGGYDLLESGNIIYQQ